MTHSLPKASNIHKVYRVLVVDDSKAMCAFLKEVIDEDPSLSVVGCALDPYEARDKIKLLNPDILTLDIEMPKMDGITFLRNLMRLRPMPVVMISSMTSAGAAVSLEALAIGAVDFLGKRNIKTQDQLKDYTDSIRELVRSAANASLQRGFVSNKIEHKDLHQEMPTWRNKIASGKKIVGVAEKVICIGASTGGPEAVKHVLQYTHAPNTAAIIAQHMPSRFIPAFAERLDKCSDYAVEPSYDGAPLGPGRCYVAAGDSHTSIEKRGNQWVCCLSTGEKVNGHQPAVDVLFHSAAALLGKSALGVLLTGMGQDGASGLKAMHDKGAMTIVQDEKSSAVWGMPGSAVRLQAAEAILPLHSIGSALTELLKH